MTTAAHPFLAALLGAAPAPEALPWLTEVRRAALERAHTLSVPTTRDEDWRFTDLSPLYKSQFRTPAEGALPDAAALAPFKVPEAAERLVFVDGRFAPGLSSHGTVAAALDQTQAATTPVRDTLARIAGFEHDAFAALNLANLRDGAVIHVGRNAVGGTVHLLFVSTQADVAVHPRVLVVAESGADVTLVEDYVALHDGAYWVNGTTEVAVGANARVRHVRLQRESLAAFHVGTCAARVERDGRYESHSVALGARLSRLTLNVQQAGTGAHADLMGLAFLHGRQLADTHSLMDHALPQGTSNQLHKCVLDGNAHAVFNGRIVVRHGAQQTDAAQQNRNLLLSRRAHVDTKPQLEILADDVKCSHGATVGQLESDELFYLRSRGLTEALARSLLTYGFAAEIVDGIPVPSVRDALRRRLLAETNVGGA
jgi:Fe-S cluster assembly protein SufD